MINKVINKFLLSIFIPSMISLCTALVFFVIAYRSVIPDKKELRTEIAQFFVFIAFVLLIIVYVYLIADYGTIAMKNSQRIAANDDSIFEEIDKIGKDREKESGTYLAHIRMINWLYRKDGDVDKLCQKDFKKILARLDKLENREEKFDKITDTMAAMGISFVISIIVTITIGGLVDTEESEELIKLKDLSGFRDVLTDISNTFYSGQVGQIMIIVLAVVMVVTVVGALLVLFYSGKRGRGGDLNYIIDDYEIKLLRRKILCYERRLSCRKQDIDILNSQCLVIKKLRDQINPFSNRDRNTILGIIREIEKLNLYLDDYSGYTIKSEMLDNKECVLIYKYNGEDTQQITENYLVGDYKKFYKIINENFKREFRFTTEVKNYD